MTLKATFRLLCASALATVLFAPMAGAKATYASKMEIGNLLFFNGDIDRAIRAFEEAAELNPKAVEPHTSLLNLYVQKGSPEAMEKATAECQEVLARKPQSKDVHLLLGNLLRNKAQNESNPEKQKTDFEMALAEIQTAENLGVSKALCEYSMAAVDLQKGDLDGAYAHINESLKEDANSADAHLIHAVLTYKRLNSDKKQTDGGNASTDSASSAVLDELDTAIKLKPKNAEAHNTKAEILLASGDLARAAAEYRKALDDDPHYFQALIGLGSCNAQLATKELDPDKAKEDIKQARDAFEQAKQIKPDDKNILYALGVTLEKLGLYKEAIDEFSKDLMLETDPITRATITLHIQQLRQGAGVQLDVAGATGSNQGQTVGQDLFTSGALAIPFKNLIQVPDEGKKKGAEDTKQQ